jgi:hypothetical protein
MIWMIDFDETYETHSNSFIVLWSALNRIVVARIFHMSISLSRAPFGMPFLNESELAICHIVEYNLKIFSWNSCEGWA